MCHTLYTMCVCMWIHKTHFLYTSTYRLTLSLSIVSLALREHVSGGSESVSKERAANFPVQGGKYICVFLYFQWK